MRPYFLKAVQSASLLVAALAMHAAARAAEPLAASTPPVVPAKVVQPAAPAVTLVPDVPAKTLFSSIKNPAPLEARAIGFYSKGCLAGAKALPINGTEWQAMRLSRNRNWGHPNLVSFLERFAQDVRRLDGWPGLLVGDMSQPRGGPMESNHASHQVGLDVDIWYDPMPARRLTRDEREEKSASSLLKTGTLIVDPKVWSADHVRLLKRAASFGEVERVFVHPAIKKALCESTRETGPDRAWLTKVRPYWGHHYHFHVRIGCPKDNASCKPQPPPAAGDDGCGAELTDWIKRISAPAKPVTGPPKPPPPPVTMAHLPSDCRVVLETGISKGIVRSSAAGGPTAAARAVQK